MFGRKSIEIRRFAARIKVSTYIRIVEAALTLLKDIGLGTGFYWEPSTFIVEL